MLCPTVGALPISLGTQGAQAFSSLGGWDVELFWDFVVPNVFPSSYYQHAHQVPSVFLTMFPPKRRRLQYVYIYIFFETVESLIDVFF